MTKKTAVKRASQEAKTTAPAVPEPPSPAKLQLKAYDEAVAFFSQRRLREARELFLKAATGPDIHVADKGRTYAQVCERRMGTAALELRSAEDHFNYGVERLNERDFGNALTHFQKALELEPRADHVYYTMALCRGLSGDGDGACENLKRAIDLEPKNRILARQDPEFAAILPQVPGLRHILFDLPTLV